MSFKNNEHDNNSANEFECFCVRNDIESALKSKLAKIYLATHDIALLELELLQLGDDQLKLKDKQETVGLCKIEADFETHGILPQDRTEARKNHIAFGAVLLGRHKEHNGD